jgi:hydroxymethylbilane synthase
LGTRAGALALWQAEHVAGLLRAQGVEAQIVTIKTLGDLDRRSDFGAMDAKGIFVKEIELALLDDAIDLAVHSLKDMPTSMPEGLVLAATPPRESALDGWHCPAGLSLEALPPGARVATGSLRRQAQLLALRPDAQVVPIRGNVATRLEKVRRGEADATLLAVAGMRRLGLEAELTEAFSPDRMTPAMGQGTLGIQARRGELTELMAALNDPATRLAVDAERAFLSRVGGGCKTPVGVYVRPSQSAEPGEWLLTAMLASPDGRRLDRRELRVADGAALAERAVALAEAMFAEAPPEIRATLSGKEPFGSVNHQ